MNNECSSQNHNKKITMSGTKKMKVIKAHIGRKC